MRSPTRKAGSEACFCEEVSDVVDDVDCEELLSPLENLNDVLENEADLDVFHDNKSFQNKISNNCFLSSVCFLVSLFSIKLCAGNSPTLAAISIDVQYARILHNAKNFFQK